MLRLCRARSFALAVVLTGIGCSSAEFTTAPGGDDDALIDDGGDVSTSDIANDTSIEGGADSSLDTTIDPDAPDSAPIDSGSTDGTTVDGIVEIGPDALVEVAGPCDGKGDGTTCGSGGARQICIHGACVATKCGDGYVDIGGGEECDDGRNVAGSGCEPTCKFTCHDAVDCADKSGCVVGSVCDVSHRCTTGSPAPSLTPCKLGDGSSGVCDASKCVKPGCEPPVKCGVGACERVGATCSPSSCTPGTGSAETCNGIDDDCNGKVDDGLTLSSCGVGACARTGTTCAASSCTPAAPTAETCNNVDDDCNGKIDDGVTRSCYDGPGGTSGVGICHAGSQTCTAGVFSTTCAGEVTPATEICNGADDDCNGKVDDGIPLSSCGTGECHRTGTTCAASSCTPGAPTAEICDGKDNNCNGVIDDGVPLSTCGVGECRRTGSTCFASTCTAGSPTPEVCDNKDNNCDGTIDEFDSACYTGDPSTRGKGVCHDGSQHCSAGSYGACGGQVLPSPEICDAFDNNCNGSVDEGLPMSTCGVGACHRTGTTCFASSCTPGAPTAETCNGIDDDCNGTVDNDVPPRSCYDGPAATRGVGLCKDGSQTCVVGGSGTWGSCTGQVLPDNGWYSDGADHNCSGSIELQYPSVAKCSGTDAASCSLAAQGFIGSVPSCGGSTGFADDCTWSVTAKKCVPVMTSMTSPTQMCH